MKDSFHPLKKNWPLFFIDLDDTLFDTRFRTLAILKEIAHTHLSMDWISQLTIQDISYHIEETLKPFCTDSDLIKSIKKQWVKKFFSASYLKYDRPFEGASKWVKELNEHYNLVYLSGRTSYPMRANTLKSLIQYGLPLFSPHGLITKANTHTPDNEFKGDIFESTKHFPVAGIIENEPLNLYQFHQTYPQASCYLLNSMRASSQSYLPPHTTVIDSFLQAKAV